MKQHYKKIFLEDEEQEALIQKVNNAIANISPGNLTDVSMDAIIQSEDTRKLIHVPDDAQLPTVESMHTEYKIKYTAIITILIEEELNR
jgi:hypothetical protein